MAPRACCTYATLKATTVGVARLDRLSQRGRGAGMAFLGGLLAQALSPIEMTDLTIALYGLSPPRASQRQLTAWERDWFAASLPPAPAHLLVTAAGTGREVAGLREVGYTVDAFEPATSLVAEIPPAAGALALRATYADLVRAVGGDAHSPAVPIAARRYDAVVLGWGSFTHVLDESEQRGLLAACGALCTDGPILASFWAATGAPQRGRAFAAGTRTGRLIAGVRGAAATTGADQPGAAALDREALGFGLNVGFTRRFSRHDIDDLASGVGREVTLFDLEPYAHATLAPRA